MPSRRYLIFGACCAVPAVVFAFTFSEAFCFHRQSEASVLQVDNSNFDFGTITDFSEKTIEHRFKLYNPSSRTILIKEIRSSCGCLVAQGASSIPSHGEANVDVHMTINGLVGDRLQNVAVKLTDNSIILLAIKAHVADEFLTFPPILAFAKDSPKLDRDKGVKFTLIRKTGAVTLTAVSHIILRSPDPNVSVKVVYQRENADAKHVVLIDELFVQFQHIPARPADYSILATYGDGAQWPFAVRLD